MTGWGPEAGTFFCLWWSVAPVVGQALGWSGSWILYGAAQDSKIVCIDNLACEEALLFGRAKRGTRKLASERRSRARFRVSSHAPLARLLFTISRKRRACSQAVSLKKKIGIDSSVLKKKLTFLFCSSVLGMVSTQASRGRKHSLI